MKFHDVFALEDSDRSAVQGVEHVIDTRRVPFALRKKITSMVKDMLDAKVIQE